MERNKIVVATLCGLTLIAAEAIAQVNVGARRHPELHAAQVNIEQAMGRLDAAQAAHDWDLNGHAQHAKDLLAQADAEVKAAAITANQR